MDSRDNMAARMSRDCTRSFRERRSQRARYGPDDWVMIPALVLVFGMAATILAGVAQNALGHPTPKPTPGSELTATSPQQTVTRKAYMAITLLQTAALTFIKISCMLFYHRIFRTASSVANFLIYAIIGLISIWGVGFFFSFLFACNMHFDFFWTNLENQLKCPADFNKINLSLSVSDVMMDFLILIFPIPWILRMQMSLGKKMLVLSIFTLGGLYGQYLVPRLQKNPLTEYISAVAASITRLVIIVEELNIEFEATADEDFVSTAGLYFMFNEACLALIAVCLPSLSGLRNR
uniref:Putative manganese efflux pump MntP n=1 Tax=Talaromyces marneffei PM1 TaxID=1077442 RepID=A0A093XU49_TALMA